MDTQLSFNHNNAALWIAAYITTYGLAGVIILVLGLIALLLWGIPHIRNRW